MAIIHPLKPRMSAHTVIGVIFVIWLSSFGVALPNLMYGTTGPRGFETVCFLNWPDGPMGETDFMWAFFSDFELNLMHFFQCQLFLSHKVSEKSKLPKGSVIEQIQRCCLLCFQIQPVSDDGQLFCAPDNPGCDIRPSRMRTVGKSLHWGIQHSTSGKCPLQKKGKRFEKSASCCNFATFSS